MRIAVFAIALAYALVFGWTWVETVNGGGDAAGRGMALGFLTIGMGMTAIFVIPALILAIVDRALKWALGLALVPAALIIAAAASDVI